MAKKIVPSYSPDELRQLILKYFYDRSANATSLKGKKGSAVKMKDVKAELKGKHGVVDSQIISNLTYLISQGWIEEKSESKSFTTANGITIPQTTAYYSISATGTDKIEGPSQFTPKKFEGINIKATGSVITIGDGNQVNVKFKETAEALSELRNAIVKTSEYDDSKKLDIITDIDSIQNQLAKPEPNKPVIKTLWEGIERVVTAGSLVDLVTKTAPFIIGLVN